MDYLQPATELNEGQNSFSYEDMPSSVIDDPILESIMADAPSVIDDLVLESIMADGFFGQEGTTIPGFAEDVADAPAHASDRISNPEDELTQETTRNSLSGHNEDMASAPLVHNSDGAGDTLEDTFTGQDAPSHGEIALQEHNGAADNAATIIYEYNENDVLCGKGCISFNHSGNRRFRQHIAQAREKFHSSKTLQDKKCAVNEVIIKIGARFLQPVDTINTSWYVLDKQGAKKKVGQALRSAGDPSKKKTTVGKAFAPEEEYEYYRDRLRGLSEANQAHLKWKADDCYEVGNEDSECCARESVAMMNDVI